LGRQPGEIEALLAIKNDARRITLRNSGTAWRDGYKSNRHRSAGKLQSGFHHRMRFGEIIDGVDRMNGTMEAAVNGAILGAGVAIWLIAGYLIQRFAFRNPRPTYATVLATSMSASMLLFSLGALLAFHIR
jgi:predicted phage tail protein